MRIEINGADPASAAISQVIAAGSTYTVADNTQFVIANQVVTASTAAIITEGTGVITYVN